MLARHVRALSSVRGRQSGLFYACHRSFATEAASDASSRPPPATTTTTESQHVKRLPKPHIRAGVILARAPLLTQTPSAFERAYFAYTARIRRALHGPFSYDFYFKHGSPLEARFVREERAREAEAFGEGLAGAGGEWDRLCELTAREDERSEAKEDDEEETQKEEEEEVVFMPREHEADINGDIKSLDRQGERHLYLLLREKEGEVWRFPQGGLEKGELLHQAAQRNLYSSCSDRMDVWIVNPTPIGVYESPTRTKQRDLVFFLKAHILAGRVHANNSLFSDFAWLTKEEIQQRVDQQYWCGVKDMLSDH